MSDTFTPRSPFAEPSSVIEAAPSGAATSSFDATSFDRRMKEIGAAEQRWSLPALPDAVKFDLANQDVEPSLLGKLLTGWDSDFNTQPTPPAGIRSSLRDPGFGLGRLDRSRTVVAQIVGEEAPTKPTVDAVKRFKLEAIERGLMDAPPNGVVDSTWDPSLNSARWQMIQDDYESDMAGEGWGSMPTENVLDKIGKWTQPSGLLAAATELDLFWDFGAIGSEFSSWGDKWQKLGDSKNPLDFGKNLLDAVTGPLDDIVLPALNIAMLATGVGSVTNLARIGWMASRVGRGGMLVRGLYHAGAVTTASNLASLGQASWTATRLMKSGSEALQAAGRGMEAWRALEGVKKGKSVAQLGMRLGFLTQAEDMLPGYKGGYSLADISPIGASADALRRVGQSPLALPVELLVAPYNIWTPGTFLKSGGEGLNVLSKTGASIVRYAGTSPGRMTVGATIGLGIGALGDDNGDLFEGMGYGALAGALLPHVGRGMSTMPGRIAAGASLGAAIGAGTAVLADEDVTDGAILGAVAGTSIVGSQSVWARHLDVDDRGLSKWIGQAGDFLQLSDYKPLVSDQRVSMSFNNAMRRYLQGDQLSRFDSVVKEKQSVVAGFADYLGTDEDSAAAAMSFVMVSAAIDHTASAQASLTGARGSKNWWQRHYLARNKLTAQLRTFDLSNVTSSDIDDMIRASIADSPDTKTWTKRFDKLKHRFDDDPAALLETAARHNDTATATIRQLLSPENFPDVDNVVGAWGKTGVDESLSIIEEYLPQVMPTFGNWPKFVGQTEQIKQWSNTGLYDLAPIAPYKTPYGKLGKVQLEVSGTAKREAIEAEDALLDALFDPGTDTVKALRSGVVSPLAKLSPAGKPTAMLRATPDKQEVAEVYADLKDMIKAHDRLRVLTETGGVKQLADAAAARGYTDLAEMPRAEFEALVDQVTVKYKPAARHLKSFAERKGWSFSELKDNLNVAIESLATDAKWADRYNLPAVGRVGAKTDDGKVLSGIDLLKQRSRQLAEKRKYTAARIDTDDWVKRVREVQGDDAADQLAAEIKLMDEDGYKLVHGVEFLMPQDLTQNAMFADFGQRQLNAATLGNFFRKRLPAERRWLEERAQRLALSDSISHRLGRDLHPDDAEVTDILDDLWSQVLKPKQDELMNRMDDYHNMSFVERKAIALESSRAPMRLEDLAKEKKLVYDRLLRLGYDEKTVDAVYAALPKFRNTQFDNLGLYSFEAKLRTRNELVQSLKFFSGTKYGESVWSRGTQGRRIGAAIGAMEGYEEGGVEGAILGGVGGAVAGTALVGGASKLAAGKIASAVDKAELMRFGQLGDRLVRMRDFLRFSMSPFFDVSRYTEGLMLAQTAAPKRLADGSRLVLPLNMSPKATRARAAKRLVEKGLSQREAATAADVNWSQWMKEWRAAAAGDFDPEVMDPMGKWFKQVGMMGFSPSDWMVSAFAELRLQEVGAAEAYQAVRDMYTYGSRGRSAAEMSINTIVFPFSFQKKALGHITEWLNDDLSRSIILHDAFKTFEILDQEYDLKERWSAHLPMFGQLNKLNLLAFGVSPGRWGGINRQLFESGYEMTLAPFMPWGASVKNQYERSEATQLFRSMLPVYNDIDWMVKDLKDQGHVLMSDSHKTARNQIDAGYREWGEYKDNLYQQLEGAGYTWSDLMYKPYLAETKLAYEMKRAELAQKYPEWNKSRLRSIEGRVSEDMEKSDRLARAAGDPATATVTDLQLAEMERQVALVRDELRYQGVDVTVGDGFLDAPPWAFEYIQELGVRMLRQNPEWQRMWSQYYESTFGPLEAKLGMEFAA